MLSNGKMTTPSKIIRRDIRKSRLLKDSWTCLIHQKRKGNNVISEVLLSSKMNIFAHGFIFFQNKDKKKGLTHYYRKVPHE